MFSFVQWDSPLTLLLEILLSVAVIVVVMGLARLAGARGPEPRVPGPESGPDDSAPGTRDSSQPGHEP